MRYSKYITYVFLLIAVVSIAQKKAPPRALENKKKQLLEEVKQLNQLLRNEKKNEKSTLSKIEKNLTRIKIQKEIVSVINNQISELDIKIQRNRDEILNNEDKLKKLKRDYALIIQQTYKSKSQQNRMMFILSSDNFLQAYRRIQYMKQYSRFRYKQGLQIQQTIKTIETLNKQLKERLIKKETLKNSGQQQQQKLQTEQKQQKQLVKRIKRKETTYKSLIRRKLVETKKIDQRIDMFVRNTIGKSRKKGKGSMREYSLTPEGRQISVNFLGNKGSLIWPVSRGVIIRGYGQYTDPVYPKIKYFNNGISIATSPNEVARAVFSGEVSGIQKILGGNKAVQIRHGSYITTYYNLSKVYVTMGEKIKTKQMLGEIHTNSKTNKTELKFYIYQNSTKLNPERWISKQ